MPKSTDPRRRPVIAYGAMPGRLGSLGQLVDIVERSDVHAIDLDLRDAWMFPRASGMFREAESQALRLRSVWLPTSVEGMFAERRLNALRELLVQAKRLLGLRTVIVPRQRDTLQRLSTIHSLAREVAGRRDGSQVRLVIGLQAGDFRHDRWHLDQLAGIRRMAEEWDLDLALDLSGNVSLAWEAEAAVMRVLPRLTLVRLGQWRREDGTLVGNQTGQIASRTVAMLADQGYSGVISVCSESRGAPTISTVIARELEDIQQRFVPTDTFRPARTDLPISDFTRHDS